MVMQKILLCGCNGRMGQTVSRLCAGRKDITVAAGCDTLGEPTFDYPVYKTPREYQEKPDVVLDFSNPASLNGLLGCCCDKKIPLLLCTTGYDAAQLAAIENASQEIPQNRRNRFGGGL
jgi:4-hydroxy-tetrahydrodipicolinate reductase